MDYEKKYNEALERARKIHDEILNNELLGFPEQIREIFPELRESEDEKIIKAIRLVLIATEDEQKDFYSTHGLTRKDCTAWLEKQKEQKPIEWSEEDENMIEHIVGSLTSLKNYVQDNISMSENLKEGVFKRVEREQDWLKSLRPSWKPSEEQMNCLCATVDAAIRKHNESVSGYEQARILKSLYEQLKKL